MSGNVFPWSRARTVPDPTTALDDRLDPDLPPEGPPRRERPDGPSESDVARLLDSPTSLRSVYQPIVDLRSGACSGFRAFVRVADSPGRSPRSWFGAAAAAGLGGRLEAASLRAALRARTRLAPDQLLVVPTGGRFVDDPEVLAVLATEPHPHRLVAEVTGDRGRGEIPEVAALRSAGIGIACAVVEAGLPELELIGLLRPDLVSIGPALVRGVAGDPLLTRMTRLVVQTATEVGAAVVATGLEDLDDARLVQRLGVPIGQGWLFGRPRPAPVAPEEPLVRWVAQAWHELVAQARVARLAGPVPPGWRSECDALGRLLYLTTDDGHQLPAGALPRLRGTQELRSAAARLAGVRRDPAVRGLVVVIDADGAFLGVTDRETVLCEALGHYPDDAG